MAIHKFTRAIVSGQPITMFGDGSTRRDYTFVDDIVAGTVAAIERTMPGAYTVYNLGGTTTTSLSDLIAQIEQTLDKKAIIQSAALQPGDVPITYADITNSKRDLDYQPKTALQDGLTAFWDWFRRFELGGS
jgi:UDP-glucuronate 4-epimerase